MAWQRISPEVTVRGVKKCRISSAMNETDNNNNNIYLTAIGLSPSDSGFKHIYKYLTLCY